MDSAEKNLRSLDVQVELRLGEGDSYYSTSSQYVIVLRVHYSVWSLASNTTVSNWPQSQGRPTKSIVKSETVSTRRHEEDSKVFSIPWVDVHHNLPSKGFRSKTGQLPTKVNIRSILLGRSERNCRWDSLSKVDRYKATWSWVQPRRWSQLLSES